MSFDLRNIARKIALFINKLKVHRQIAKYPL